MPTRVVQEEVVILIGITTLAVMKNCKIADQVIVIQAGMWINIALAEMFGGFMIMLIKAAREEAVIPVGIIILVEDQNFEIAVLIIVPPGVGGVAVEAAP